VDAYVYTVSANIDQSIRALPARNCDWRKKSREGESWGGEGDGLHADGYCMLVCNVA